VPGYSDSDLTAFNSKWRELFNVAHAHNIAPAAIQQVYSLDLNRLGSGTSYALSKEEAWAALTSASSGAPTTQAPVQPFSAGRLPGYLGHDVQDFGVGILGLIKKGISDVAHPITQIEHGKNPLSGGLPGQVSALWRDPTVIEDPVKAMGELYVHPSLGNLLKQAGTTGHSPLLSAVVPGAADIGQEVTPQGKLTGTAGLEQLGEHPFTSALDLAGAEASVGRLGGFLSKIGLTEAERGAIDDASRYRPTDTSTEAQAARKAAQEAVPGALRRAAATGNGGLLAMMNRFVMDAPLNTETIGTWAAHKLSSVSGGQTGPIAAMVGRLLQSSRRTYATGLSEISKDLDGWYTEHGLVSTKDRTDFSWLLTHWRDDWKTAYTDRFTPDEMGRLENAATDYDNRVAEQTNKDLAEDKLAQITDPRDGRSEIRATEGSDRRVVGAQKLYTKRRAAALDVSRQLADATGVDVPADAAGAWQAVQGALARNLLADAAPFIGVELHDPALVRAMFPGDRSVSSTNISRVTSLFGRNGRFAKLAIALSAGDLDKVGSQVGAILKTLRSQTARRNAKLEAMIPAYERAQKVIALAKKVPVKKALLGHDRARDVLTKAIDRNPEARFTPRMAELVQDRLLTHLNGQDVNPEDFDMLFDQISNGLWKGEKFGDLVGPREMGRIRNSALNELVKERDAGLAPKFVYSTTLGEHENLAESAFQTERISTTRSAKSRASINPAAVYDPILGLLRKQAEDLETDVMTEFFFGEQGFLRRWSVKYDDALHQGLQLISEGKEGTAIDRRTLVDRWVRDNYTEIRPSDYFPRAPASAAGLASAIPVLVPKDVAQALEANLKAMRGPRNAAGSLYVKGTRIFRRTLLGYSPRYQAHIWLGGTTLLLLRSDPVTISRHLAAALGMTLTDHTELLKAVNDRATLAPLRPVAEWLQRRAAKAGESGGLNPLISHELPESDPQDLMSHYKYATGSKLGQWWKEIQDSKSATVRGAASVVSGQAGTDIAAFGANMLRATAYLIGKEKGGVEEGIRFALKVYADMDGMTPLERSIIRYVMPFYGWTRHVLHYVFTLPVDHPYRVGILSQMVNQEWEDWNSGLPQSLMYLFQIGATDAAGNATSIDIRQLDPLRSVTDVFTMAGFLSTLNPAFQNVVLPMLGVDPATGGPEQLYPTMTLNEFTGAETPTPVSLSSILEAGVMGYVPEASVLDHFLGWASYTRWAKANDPQAYRNQLTSALNFPWLPETVNLRQQIAKTEIDRYNVARDAATAALADPNPNSPAWKALMGYIYVPYQGWLVQPQALRSWAFDQVAKAGYWDGSAATIAPSSLIIPPSAPNI
jgi:hypothetical protein